MKRNRWLLIGALLAAGAALRGAAAPGDTASSPEEAGPDYTLQGEYTGTAGSQKLGAQVIALGDGAFRAVFLPGGLPGEGWDTKTRIRVDGRAEGGQVRFEGGGWEGRIQSGGSGYEIIDDRGIPQVFVRESRGGGEALEGRSDQGETFTLRKVMRKSPTMGLKPPPGAAVLFDGKNADAWAGGKMTEDGLLMAGTTSKQSFGDFTMHMEFRLPFMPKARGQGRANSGVYLQNRYEVQILDSFGLNGENNECGGLYSQTKPAVNMCYPPLTWQTYDIDLQSARFDSTGQKVKPAVVTIRHNGVTIHDHVELKGPTPSGAPEKPTPGPFQIQNHGNPVVVRNIWVVEKK